LGNDYVIDQIIALLNSIEVIYGQTMPVCIYPYDENTEKLADEIAQRPYVTLYNQQDSMQTWDKFTQDIWDLHPTAQKHWMDMGLSKYYRLGSHRRYGAFDGPFDHFVYMDADTILMSKLDDIFAQLNNYDWVVYDFQFKDLSHIYSVSSVKLKDLFSQERLKTEVFCAGFYGSKKDIFPAARREMILEWLRQGEAEVLFDMAADQTILNYMVMRLGISQYNFALNLPPGTATGNAVTSLHFENRDNILYDKGNRLTYLHYIGLSSQLFKKVCAGENIEFPYRDIFLHYRYLHEPEKRPKFTTKGKAYNAPPSLSTKIFRKLGLTKK
ncbi:MAG: sugar transferase, partial [Sphaerospermopsis sp. SIO1G2]|nr:sugar transferase [Sphaerospermopsis sp. SIO1G2]